MGKVKIYFRFTLLVLLLNVGFSFAQGLNVFYDLTFKPIKNSSKTEKEVMILQIDVAAKRSYYQSANRLKYDSLTTVVNSLGNTQYSESLIARLPKFVFNHLISKNISTKSITVFESLQHKWYSANESKPIKWEIEAEKKVILGYDCYLATTSFGGRRWNAWFAPSVPIPDGPYKFHGLPGLILGLRSDDGDYDFTSISIENVTPDVPALKSTQLSMQQFQRLKTKIAKDPAAQLRQLMLGDLRQAHSMDIKYDGKESGMTNRELIQQENMEYWQWMKSHNNPLEVDDIWLK